MLDRKRDISALIVENGIRFLAVFSPLAFGSVSRWASAVMELAAFIVLAAWIFGLKRIPRDRPFSQGRIVWVLLSIVTVLGVVQSTPIPESIVSVISPKTLEVYRRFLGQEDHSLIPISVAQAATGEAWYRFLAYAAVFTVIVHHYATRRQIASLVKLVVGMGCLLVIFAIIQKTFWNGRLFWLIPIDPSLEKGAANVWGPYINRNHFAGYLEMVVPLAVGLLLYKMSSVRTVRGQNLARRITSYMATRRSAVIALYLLASVGLSAAILTTLSRGGVISLLVSLAVIVLLSARRAARRKKAGVLLLLGVLLAVVLAPSVWERFEERFIKLSPQYYVIRTAVWHDSLGIVRDFPFLGSGMGTFGQIYSLYQTTGPTLYFDQAHNDYLQLVAECGVFGALLTLAIISAFLGVVLGNWRKNNSRFAGSVGVGALASLAAMLTHASMDFNFHIPANALLFSMIAAIAWTTMLHVRSRDGRSERGGSGPA